MNAPSKQYCTIMEPDKLMKFIDGELTPKKKEKTDNGEVFTPLSLVKEMIDKLDDAYKNEHGRSIFTEKDFKWLDPAVGIGNFPIVVYQQLMEGLKPAIRDEEERRKHILEEMLYMSELTENNIYVCKKIFCGEKYKLRVIEGDSLKMDMARGFNLPDNFTGFDVVMGNPPYNADGIKHKGDKNIYVYFSTLALKTWLRPKGYLVYIHPPVYRIPNHKIQHTKTNLNEIYTNHKILCIKMYSIVATKVLMSVMMNTDFIIIQNTENDTLFQTEIIDTKGDEYKRVILPNDFIPNFGINIMNKIKNKNPDGNVSLTLNSEMHAQKMQGSTYKNVHGIFQKG